jgi:hypothetical protein
LLLFVADSVEGCPAENQPLGWAKRVLLGYGGMRFSPGKTGQENQ